MPVACCLLPVACFRRALLLALVVATASARADGTSTGFAADRLRLGVGPAVLAGAEGAETTASGEAIALFGVSYIREPITLRSTVDHARISVPVRNQLVGTVGAELGLPRRFAIQVSLPVAMWNDGDRLRSSGATGDDASAGLHAAAGDLLLGIKVALLGHPEEPGLHVALALDGTAPLGGQYQFAAASGPTLAPRLYLDYRLPWLSMVLDAQVRFQSQRSLFATTLGDELDIAGGVIGRLVTFGRMHLLAYLEAAGVVAGDASARAAELRGALRLSHPHVDVDVGAGGGLTDALGSPKYRLFATLRVPLRGKQ